MSRRAVGCRSLILVAVFAGLLALGLPARAGEDPRTVVKFLQELKTHGMHEEALYFIGQLRDDASLPADLKVTLDYEEGRTLIDEASRSNDLVLRDELLRDAKEKLDGFVKANPQRPEARDALVQLAKMLVERGYLAVLQSEDTKDKSKKDAKLAEARAAYIQAREAYGKAVEALKPALAKYPVSMSENDPRRPERDLVEASYLDAMLQQGVCDHELAQTYPEGAPERTKLLDGALKQFQDLHNAHREQWAGLTAQMWQAKCFEEKGELGPAIGIYKQLLEHTDPRLRGLQRNVGYFYIVALAKRQEYPLAADQATAWLRTYNRPQERRSKEGIGVQLELAKAIDAQMSGISADGKTSAARQIVDSLNQVVRFASPYKNEALALLKKYKPSSALKAEEISRLTYQDAMEKADEAISANEWDRAITLLKAAARKADVIREPDKVNMARYNLAFCYFMNKQYYEAYVMAEHLVRRYPRGGLSPKATTIAMQALVEAYNTYTDIDRMSDIDRVVDIAQFAAETWPDREEGDEARLNLGQIALGQGKYDHAIDAFAGIRRKSARWLEAQTRLGAAHWAKSRVLERRGDVTTAAAEGAKAIDVLQGALKVRRESGTAATDPGLVGNVGDLAIVLTESGKATEALQLVEPIARAQTIRSGPAYSRLMEAQLMAFIGTNQVQKAIDTMKTLEQAGGGANLTQLYLKLGRLLQRELDSLKQKGNTTAYAQMHQSYKTFLTTLAGAKAGQTYESLEWAGESLLSLDAYKEAEDVLQRVLKEFIQDPQFLQQPNGKMSALRTRLKLAAALRGQGRAEKAKFEEADKLVADLLKEFPKYLEPQLEKGMLLEAQAEAKYNRVQWSTALGHWQALARKLEAIRPRRLEYYDAWYHIAWALYQQRETVKARQTLQGIMRLTPTVGSPEMKTKYEALLQRLAKK
jgi:cellulose synthase operon protein C